MEHAIVAGGAGFIGHHLVEALVRRGWEVTVLDNLSSGARLAIPRSPSVRFLFHSVVDPLPDLPRAHAIFHLASPAVPANYVRDPGAVLDANDLGTRHLIARALRDNAPLLYASTSEVYGDLDGNRVDGIREDEPARVHLARARSCYAEAKRFGEELVLADVKRRGLDGRVVRLFNVYGPGMDRSGAARVIPSFVRVALRHEAMTIHGDGTQTRSFCWIEDAVDALCLAAIRPGIAGAVLNVGNPEMVTVRELAALVGGMAGSRATVKVDRDPFEPRWRKPDISKAREVLGWSPRVALADGLPRVIESTRREREPDLGIGVVVPTYARPDRLRRLVAALDDLETPPQQVVIVDDASPGGIPAWLDAWQANARYRATVLRQQRNAGPAAARNAGLRALNTELVAFTDDDCEPRPNWIAALVRGFADKPPSVAGVGGRVLARGDDIVSRYYVHQRILEPPPDKSYLVTANACFRRDLVVAVGGFDEAIRQAGGEDPGLCFELAREGFEFDIANDAVVVHDFRASVRDLARTFRRYGEGCFHVLRSA